MPISRRSLNLGLLGWLGLGAGGRLSAEEPKASAENSEKNLPERRQISFPYPVAFPAEQAKVLGERAEALAKRLGTFVLGPAKTNPVCCFWLCIDGFTPNPGDRGYIIVVQSGGAFLQAADLEELDAGLAALREAITDRDGKAYLPIGMITNYRAAELP